MDIPACWLGKFLIQMRRGSLDEHHALVRDGWSEKHPLLLAHNYVCGTRVMDGTHRLYSMLDRNPRDMTPVPTVISFGDDSIETLLEAAMSGSIIRDHTGTMTS